MRVCCSGQSCSERIQCQAENIGNPGRKRLNEMSKSPDMVETMVSEATRRAAYKYGVFFPRSSSVTTTKHSHIAPIISPDSPKHTCSATNNEAHHLPNRHRRPLLHRAGLDNRQVPPRPPSLLRRNQPPLLPNLRRRRAGLFQHRRHHRVRRLDFRRPVQ
jgi:hypothetical protein